MIEQISINHDFFINPLIMQEEQFNRSFFKNNQNLKLELPCDSDTVNLLLKCTYSPYYSDNAFQNSNISNNNITDSILDYYCTNIYSNIVPNYMPTILHGHTYYEVVYIFSGHCINFSGNQIFNLEKGDFMILAPNTNHAISAFNEDCRLVNIMIRATTFLEIFFKSFSESNILHSTFKNVFNNNNTNTFILFHTKQDDIIQYLNVQLLEETQKLSINNEKIRESLLQMMFIQLESRHSGHSEVFSDDVINANKDVSLMLNFMNIHYNTVKLSDLSIFFGYSERQISRILFSQTQKSFSEHIISIKMNKAVYLLKTTSLTVDEISEIVGYSTTYGFRKKFKDFFEITPSEYRNANVVK